MFPNTKKYTDYLENSLSNSMYLESIDPSIVIDVVKKSNLKLVVNMMTSLLSW
jgi:hypothetical protein